MSSKVLLDLVFIDIHLTIVKLRVVVCNQQLIRLDFEKSFHDVDTAELVDGVRFYLTKYKVLVLSDYQKGSLNQVEQIIKITRFLKIPIIVDPKGS